MPCTSETVLSFSGVAYHFGEQLLRDLAVPIGVINTSWGTCAVVFIPLRYHAACYRYCVCTYNMECVHVSASNASDISDQ
jgi:hypothetical protein